MGQRRARVMPAILRQDQTDFIFRMGRLPLAEWLKPKTAQQPKGGMIEKPDSRVKKHVKPMQRFSYPKRSRQWFLDGQRLGRKLAGHNMQKGDRRESNCESDPFRV